MITASTRELALAAQREGHLMRLENWQQCGSARTANRTQRMFQQHRQHLRISVTLRCYVAAECSILDAVLRTSLLSFLSVSPKTTLIWAHRQSSPSAITLLSRFWYLTACLIYFQLLITLFIFIGFTNFTLRIMYVHPQYRVCFLSMDPAFTLN